VARERPSTGIQDFQDFFRDILRTFSAPWEEYLRTQAGTGPGTLSQWRRKIMKSRVLKSVYGMCLGCALALAGAVFMTPVRGAGAEKPEVQAKSESQARKLEGTWRVRITLRNCESGEPLFVDPQGNPISFPALVTFARGGTLTSADSRLFRGPGHGIWRHTGDHTYSALTEAFEFNSSGGLAQVQRLTQVIEIGEDPDVFTANVKGEIFAPANYPNGNPNPLTTCATSVGRRME
jgi:hypothetical protein